MTNKEYQSVRNGLFAYAQDIMEDKQPAYTGENEDVLSNFKNMADRFGIDPLVAWGIYFNKHVDAINSFIKNPELHQGGEPISSRFADIINYCALGMALVKEQKHASESNKIPK